MNNLLVLARENAGAALILEKGGVEKLMNVILQEKNADEDLILAAQRVVDELARDEQRVKILYFWAMGLGLTLYPGAGACSWDLYFFGCVVGLTCT